MSPNESPYPYGRWSQPPKRPSFEKLPPVKPRIAEDTLQILELQIERKIFVFILKENPRGRFLRIIEDGGPKNSSVIVPATGLKDFQKVLADMVKADTEIPPKEVTPK